MSLGEGFEKFLARRPVRVRVRGSLDRGFAPEKLEPGLSEKALWQSTRALTFAHGGEWRSAGAFRLVPRVGAWDKAPQDEVAVRRPAGDDHLQPLELPMAAGLGAAAGRERRAGLPQRPSPPPPVLAGERVRVWAGTPWAGTDPGGQDLRRSRAAARPGPAGGFSAPPGEGAPAVLAGEDASAQARALLPAVGPRGAERAWMGAERTFCPRGGLCGGARRTAGVVMRPHAAKVGGHRPGPRRGGGPEARGHARSEPTRWGTEPAPGEPRRGRRIPGPVPTPPRAGATERQSRTTRPGAEVPAAPRAAREADRWTSATAFPPLPGERAGAVDTLGDPKAAWCGVCVAGGAAKGVALVKGALRAAPGAEEGAEQLSRYDRTWEVARVATGMAIAGEAESGEIVRQMRTAEFPTTLLAIAQRRETRKDPKPRRGPKKSPPHKLRGKGRTHVSTARSLAMRG
jgi:hypothetical protein